MLPGSALITLPCALQIGIFARGERTLSLRRPSILRRECPEPNAMSRPLLLDMFRAAVDAALPARVLPRHLPQPPKRRTIVIGAGKAGASMAEAVEKHWPGPLGGLVVTRYGHGVPC